MIHITWFNIDPQKSDSDNVVDFIKKLPDNLEILFNKKTSNFLKYYIVKDKKYGISSKIFLGAFNESVEEIRNFDKLFDWSFFKRNLKSIGFTRDSLKLKSSILNKLWDKVREYAKEFLTNFLDFGNPQLRNLMKKFLKYLNSILGSLGKIYIGYPHFYPIESIFPLDPIKEFKEIIESYLEKDD
jgi:hypothetical protein